VPKKSADRGEIMNRDDLRLAFTGAAVAAAVLACAGAFAQPADTPQKGRESDWYREIPSSEPYLPNRPARRENISDEEVREVQQAALSVYPDFIVVISGVTDGCACEEGGQCSAEVGLALNRDNVTRSLVLSKIDGHWNVGAVQSWWLQLREFENTHPYPSSWDALQNWRRARDALLKRYPACPAPAGNWTLQRNNKFSSTFVDLSSIKETGHIRRVKFKSVRDPSIPIYSYPFERFSISVEAFDCRDHRTRTDAVMHYLDDGTAYRGGGIVDPVLWNPVLPGTAPAKDLDLVCSSKIKE
jgi:hypothetical protein